MVCVDLQGKILWENKLSSGGSMGQPLVGENDSIYAAGASSVQETRLNGNNTWTFSVYSGSKGAKTPLLGGGLDNLLYLPLSNGLYGVNLSGRYIWMLSPWDTSNSHATKQKTTYEFLACTADKQTFYIVYGEKKGGYRLAAIDKQGKFLWTYWLGDITQADLITGEDGEIFATVTFKKSNSSNRSGSQSTGGSKKTGTILKGKIYSFTREKNTGPEWEYLIKESSELSVAVQYKSKTLYLTGGNSLYAINSDDGSLIWEEPLYELASPPAADPQTERIYAGGSEGDLYAVNQAGRMVWDRTLDSSIERAPLVGPDGFLYVFTEKGSLYKIYDNYK